MSRPADAFGRASFALRMRLAAVPRFFFHLYDDMTVLDEEGSELPDIEAARRHAIQNARELACHEIRTGKLSLRHRIEVQDANGNPVLTLPFSAGFELED